jgi:hypothetical protein
MMRKPWRLLLLILLGAALLFIACGKKGDPLPPDRAIPAGIAELRAQKVQGGVILRWHLPDRGNEVHRVRILRREVGTQGIDCAGCKEETQILLDLYTDDPRLVREGTGGVYYLDPTPVPDRTYIYRIIVCNISGYCSEASLEAATGEGTNKNE